MKNSNKVILLILIIFCFIIALSSVFKIIIWKVSDDENKNTQTNLNSYIIEINNTEKEKSDIVDFSKLKEQNPDTVGYLKVNNTKIDYVVVKGKNNSYYLSHNFNKKANVAGWIFADYHNKYDGSDKNLVIYGHNMKTGSMFGTLKNVLKKDWFNNKENHKILLVTESGTHYYEVFSTYVIDVEDYYIKTSFKDNNEFYKFINVLKKRSKFDYKVDLKETDSILTLSTCASGGNRRVVLHAKLIN